MGVTPGQIAFFDDNADNCAAATKRGWHVHRIDPTRHDGPRQITDHLATLGLL